MSTVFLTGGTGFVGSHLAEELLGRGYRVRCLVRNNAKWLEGLPVETVTGTLADPAALRAGADGAQYVYHVAAQTRAWKEQELFEANAVGTEALLQAVSDAAPDVRRVIVTSTLAVVGRADVLVADEETALNPVSAYGRSKVEMERRIRERWLDRLPITVIRPPSVYGERDDGILAFFRSVERGLLPVLGEKDRAEVSLIHATDLARGMVEAAESDASAGRTYFIGSEAVYSWAEVAESVRAALGNKRVLPLTLPPFAVRAAAAMAEAGGRLTGRLPPLTREKATEILHACKACSVARAMADFGFKERLGLAEGTARTARWYRANGWL